MKIFICTILIQWYKRAAEKLERKRQDSYDQEM